MLSSADPRGAARSAGPTDDPVLLSFRAAVERVYGSRRARGDARPDSYDYVALFLHDLDSFDREGRVLAATETDLLIAKGAVVNALPLRAGAYAERTDWMAELRRDGLAL